MAILTAPQLDEVRQAYVREHGVADVTKPKLNAAIQAVEDVLSSAGVQTAFNNAINTATSPAVLREDEELVLLTL